MINILKNKKVLIVDDNVANIQLLGAFLSKYNAEVMIAKDGQNALKYVEDLMPDIILLDIMMPGMNGFDVCRKLKENRKTKAIPIIFITARTGAKDIAEGFNAGGVDYITKPFLEEELIARINTHLKLQMNQKNLEELIKTKDNFFALIAHDLKNPFLNIVGHSEFIKDNLESIPRETLLSHVNRIFDSAFAQYRLLENLLEWAAFQTGDFNVVREKLSLLEVIEDITNIYEQVAFSKDINIKIDIEKNMEVYADINMVKTIFRNLISNAIKFSNKDKEVCIQARYKDNLVEIVVRDEGIGIEKESLERILADKTVSSTYGTQGEKGTGIGLKLCKEFLKLNNGKLNCVSEKAKGTSFIIYLPGDVNS